ncbi:MAG TPA: hypothetical protein VKU40_17550 [Thermoanaerobaculia bacterium]|nr:hypothetical protein [Thermoanaerobaculia bacterium]
MSERALSCPQCTAPLAPGKFARVTTCPFCGSTVELGDQRAVSAERFRSAYREWNSPRAQGFDHWVSIGDSHWTRLEPIAHGEISDLYSAWRARRPTERVLLKVLRDASARDRFDNEWKVLSRLDGQADAAFLHRLPRPVVRGEMAGGAHSGRPAMAFSWPHGTHHGFEAVRRRHPEGIEPRAAVWVWRRILETLAFLHRHGVAHGAVLPPHLLVEEGEHGVRLVGYGCAGKPGAALAAVADGWRAAYPKRLLRDRRLSVAADVAMSARAVGWLLGGETDGSGLGDRVPEPLAELVASESEPRGDGVGARSAGGPAWALRERLGALARDLFGPPAFCPIDMS